MSEFVDYLAELFEGFGAVRSRRMFGGYGLYHRDVMFALVSDDVLYLKADDALAELFETRGLPPFQYPKGDRIVALSYYEAPPELFDDPDAAATWARRAYAAAVAAKQRR